MVHVAPVWSYVSPYAIGTHIRENSVPSTRGEIAGTRALERKRAGVREREIG